MYSTYNNLDGGNFFVLINTWRRIKYKKQINNRGYDVYIGKIEEYEVDFVAINNEGRLYVQVTDTLKGSDKIPVSNEEEIKIKNVLEWLLDK